MTLRLLLTAAAFTAALLYFLLARDYPGGLSLLVALAVAALVYSAQGTGERLRRMHHGRPSRDDLEVRPARRTEPPGDEPR
jgi:hypothetical protein